MPFQIHGTISDLVRDGNGNITGAVTYKRGDVVSDVVGPGLIAQHPALVTRVPHDNELCLRMRGGCVDGTHSWNAKAPTKPSAPSAPTSPVESNKE